MTIAPIAGLIATCALLLSPRYGGAQPISADLPAPVPIIQGPLGTTLDEYLTTLERFGMHGSILVEHHGSIILNKGYGLANHNPPTPNTKDTLFHIGSLGKQFTAAGILCLQQDGRLQVTDPISRFLPDAPPDKQGITIHQLLTHTAGLPYMPGVGRPLELSLQSAPGERWAYSNPGYTLLAHIIEAVTEQPYEKYILKHVLELAGLTDSRTIGSLDWPADVAHAYTDQTDQGPVSDWGADLRFLGAGDFASSVGDLYRWERALRTNAVLTPASTQAFFTEHVRNPGAGTGYAYGWMTATTPRNTSLVFHQGNLGGFNSDYRRYLDEDLTIIFLSNHFMNGRSMRDAVMNNVSKIVNGGSPMRPPILAPSGSIDLDTLVGTYAFPDGRAITVTPGDDCLYLSAEDQESLNLLFSNSTDPETLAFIQACNDRTVSLVDAAVVHDPAVLRAEIAPSLPINGAWSNLDAILTNWSDQFGPYSTCKVIGTAAAGGPKNGKTFVTVHFRDGAELLQVTWGGRGILHITRAPFLPARRFLPQSTDTLVAFDLFTGASIAIKVDRETKPGATLTFTCAGTEQTARAVP